MHQIFPLTEENWGAVYHRQTVKRYTLSNDRLSVSVLNLGATVQRIVYRGSDMIFSLPDAKAYAKFSRACIGATVGRYAGRIAGGRFCMDGTEYQLTQNQNGNHLHGGRNGFHTKIWDGCPDSDGAGITFRRLSPDGEEGYPGDLDVSVNYRLTEDDSLAITFHAAACKKDTIVNLTNHCYFNPNGVGPFSDADNRHVELMIDADSIVELQDSLPTGRLLPVDGTPFDFRTPKILSRDMGLSAETAKNGYDHTFVFNRPDLSKPSVTAYGLTSGILLECFTDQPGTQLYTMGNPGNAFALEPQHFPDSPNHPHFPSTRLRAGSIFESHIVYRFSMKT